MLRCLTAQPEERGLQGEHGNSRAPAQHPELRESPRPRAGAQEGCAGLQPALPVPRAEPAPGWACRGSFGRAAWLSLRSIFPVPRPRSARGRKTPKEPRTPPHALLKAPLPWPGGPQGRSGTGQEYLEKANIPGQGSGAGGGS